MSNETPYPPRPHPYLTEPLIYVVGVPISLSDADLASAFEYCRPFKPTIPRGGPGPYVDGTIEFRELDTGEFHKSCFWYYIRLRFRNLLCQCLRAVQTID